MKCLASRDVDPNLQIDVAAMLFSMSAMSCSISPAGGPPSARGFLKIRSDKSVWTCFSSPTGLKIFLETPHQLESVAQNIIRSAHRAYSDFVLKNPFSIPG